MGQGDSKQSKQFLEGFNQNYKIYLENQDDQRLGKISIYRGQGSLVAVKRSHTHNKEDLEHYMENNLKLALGSYNDCTYLLKVFAYEEAEDQAMCGSINELKVYLEYHGNTLESEIQQRAQTLMYYSEQELLVILYSIIQACSFLEEKRKTIDDIRPQNIYLTKAGHLKLVPFEIFHDDVPVYGKVLTQRYPYYIAPEQLQEIREGKVKSSADPYKADIFSVGITMLQAATLQSGIDCYNMQNLQLNNYVIQQLQQISQSRYSAFFNRIINVMLLENPTNRPTPSMMHKILKPFEEPILALSPFDPNEEAVRQSLYGASTSQSTQQSVYAPQQQQVFVQSVQGFQESPIKSINYNQIQHQQIQQQPQQYIIPQSHSQSQIQYQQLTNQQYQIQEQPVRYIQVDEQQPRRNTVYQQQQQSPQYVRAQTQEVIQPQQQQVIYQSQQQPIQQQQVQQQFSYEQIQNQSPIRMIQGPQNGQYVQVVPQQQQQQQQQLQIQSGYSPIQNQYVDTQGASGISQFQVPPQYQKVQQTYAPQSPQFSQQQQVTRIAQQQTQINTLPPQYQPQQQSVRYEDGLQTIQRHQMSTGYELSDIDRRINEVLQKTQHTLEKVDHSQFQSYQ